ncbi:hypothetical protein [Microbulbifer aggregans]|uniref:hypothetical protein n=1 Tax=Microbulbifer aggregans TaxID=1769779 RepID=UPI001CFE9740|nr:hypothetical protein [Microbulbifer aggregans]
MGQANALQAANNEVMRKIGRNMLLFQQIEGLLKYLLANGFIVGTVEDLKIKRESRLADIRRRSMGQLVGEFVDSCYSDLKDTNTEELVDKAFFSFHFKVECEAKYYDSRKKTLAEIVSERNDLIHHLLPRYDPESLESCLAVDAELEQQRNKLLPELTHLQELVGALNKSRKLLSDFFQSEDGRRLFVEGLLPGESRLDGFLRTITSMASRPDGWTPLARAGQLINDLPTESVKKVCEEVGTKKLANIKKLIQLSAAFELMEETTKGGVQWLFRPKHSSDP